MRTSVVAVSSVALLAAGFLLGRVQTGTPKSSQASADRKVLHYACPMHPAVRSDHAGTAPCCGMALEPVYQGGAASEALPPGAVALGEGIRQLQGVKVAAVERGASTQSVRLFGRVVPDENRVYSLNAAMEGSIHDLAGVTTGSLVRKDQRLGAFFSADLRTALQAFMTALDVIELDPAARIHDGMTVAAGSTPNRNAAYIVERLLGLGVSRTQLAEIKQRREVPLEIDIRSPADGVVLARGVTAGQKFDKGMEWFRIANLDRVWIVADLLEGDAALARPGATARVTLPGRGEVLTATVSRVPPIFDAATRTLKVRLELDNPGGLLRPDMYADVALEVERPAALTVPVDAIMDSGLRKTVFVESGAGIFEPRQVETGWRSGGRVEVLRGLAPGERIVTSGTFLVDSESQLRGAAAPKAPVAQAPAASPKGPGATAALAAMPPSDQAAPGAAAAKDPVCGMAVDPPRARAAGLAAEHAGKTYLFCSEHCRGRFTASPEKFADAGPHGDAAGHDHGALQASAGARP